VNFRLRPHQIFPAASASRETHARTIRPPERAGISLLILTRAAARPLTRRLVRRSLGEGGRPAPAATPSYSSPSLACWRSQFQSAGSSAPRSDGSSSGGASVSSSPDVSSEGDNAQRAARRAPAPAARDRVWTRCVYSALTPDLSFTNFAQLPNTLS
jgi:hypothetical protein